MSRQTRKFLDLVLWSRVVELFTLYTVKKVRMLSALGSAVSLNSGGNAVTLNNGVVMPSLAFGANVWDASTCASATSSALDAGFRFVWSSQLIGQDCQAAQGKAIKSSSIPRNQLFIAGTANTGSCSSHAEYVDAPACAPAVLPVSTSPLA